MMRITQQQEQQAKQQQVARHFASLFSLVLFLHPVVVGLKGSWTFWQFKMCVTGRSRRDRAQKLYIIFISLKNELIWPCLPVYFSFCLSFCPYDHLYLRVYKSKAYKQKSEDVLTLRAAKAHFRFKSRLLPPP